MPLRPMVWPRVTVSPTFTSNDDRWPYSDCTPMPVVEDDAVAVNAEPAGVQHRAGVGRDDRHAAGHREVEPEVHLLVDLLALVDVGPVIGEARFDLRVAELDERPVPQPRRRRLRRERRDLPALIVRSSPLTLRNAGSISRCRRRRHLQLRRVLEDFRHDAVDELVVELDPALLERLLEHVVDEVAFASLPASSRANA